MFGHVNSSYFFQIGPCFMQTYVYKNLLKNQVIVTQVELVQLDIIRISVIFEKHNEIPSSNKDDSYQRTKGCLAQISMKWK